MRRLLLLGALLFGLSGMADAQPLASPDSVRCYDLTLSPWRGSGEDGADPLFYAPPPRVQLDTTRRAEFDLPVYQLNEPSGALPSVHKFASWQRVASGDTLVLRWSTGTAGLSAHLRVPKPGSGDTLRGRARTFIDIGGAPRYTADVTAVPVVCDSPLPLGHHAQRSLPSGVALARGDSVQLGAPLADVPGTESVAGRFKRYLRRPLAAPLDGARDVELLPDRDGRIAIIRFQWGEATDFEALVDTFTTLHGPPVHRSTHTLNDLRTTLVLWQNRSVKLSVHRSCSSDGACDISGLLARQRYRIPRTAR